MVKPKLAGGLELVWWHSHSSPIEQFWHIIKWFINLCYRSHIILKSNYCDKQMNIVHTTVVLDILPSLLFINKIPQSTYQILCGPVQFPRLGAEIKWWELENMAPFGLGRASSKPWFAVFQSHCRADKKKTKVKLIREHCRRHRAFYMRWEFEKCK